MLLSFELKCANYCLFPVQNMVTAAHKSESNLKSPWLSSLSRFLHPELLSGPESLLRAVKRSGAGWEGIAPSMVLLAKALMDSPAISTWEITAQDSQQPGELHRMSTNCL